MIENKKSCRYSNKHNILLNTALQSIQTLFIQESRDKAIAERAISNPLENYIPFISCYNQLVRIFQIFHLHSFTERENHIQIPREAKRLNKPCNSFWIDMKLASF